MPAGRRGRGQVWDKALGRKLYDEDVPYAEIAKACGVTANTVSGHADRHWPEREKPQRQQKVRVVVAPKAKPLKPGQVTLAALDSLKD